MKLLWVLSIQENDHYLHEYFRHVQIFMTMNLWTMALGTGFVNMWIFCCPSHLFGRRWVPHSNTGAWHSIYGCLLNFVKIWLSFADGTLWVWLGGHSFWVDFLHLSIFVMLGAKSPTRIFLFRIIFSVAAMWDCELVLWLNVFLTGKLVGFKSGHSTCSSTIMNP